MIKLINPDEFLRKVNAKGPITSPIIFVGKSGHPHPEGLFSEEIFGIEGSPEYQKNFSWIELNTKVISPFIYYLLTYKVERKIKDLVENNVVFTINENGELVEDEKGEIYGINSLSEHISRLKFKEIYYEDEEDRFSKNKLIKKMYEFINSGAFFIDKIIVIPPFYRPISVLQDGSKYVDQMNDIYVKIINLSIQLQNLTGKVKDIVASKMQFAVNELYEYVKVKISKKSGLIRNLMLGKPVDFSARAVISPNPYIGLGYVGLPLRIACQIFEPFILYGLFNSSYASSIPEEFHKEVKEYLKKEKFY